MTGKTPPPILTIHKNLGLKWTVSGSTGTKSEEKGQKSRSKRSGPCKYLKAVNLDGRMNIAKNIFEVLYNLPQKNVVCMHMLIPLSKPNHQTMMCIYAYFNRSKQLLDFKLCATIL